MEKFETITAKGFGFWSKNYHIELFTSSKVFRSRINAETKEVIEFGFRFKEVGGVRTDNRLFSSLVERTSFLTNNIRNLQLLPIKHPKKVRLQYFLDCLIGETLSSVTFVMDYLQMDFNGNQFIFYNWPVIHKGQNLIYETDSEYRNDLFSLINRSVVTVDEYIDLGIAIEFEDNALLCTPLKVQNTYSLPEIAEFHSRDKDHWMIWQVGDRAC
ncbi:MAG: hypothetical protein VB013_04700 [Anaerolineaceae bacterium]|nr:hypothetical protein [Anaerolineaceae bacterium]